MEIDDEWTDDRPLPEVEIDDIPDLSSEAAMDLGLQMGILGDDIRNHEEVLLRLKIHFLRVCGMEATGREPFKVLKDIQRKHQVKCQALSELFKDLRRKLLRIKEAEGDKLITDLEKTVENFEFPDSIDFHIKKLTNDECCRIMITGELCSGKTTLINSLLGETILPCSSLSNTFTLCEIRYGEQRTAHVYPWSETSAEIIILDDVDDDDFYALSWIDEKYEIIHKFTVRSKKDAEILSRLKFELGEPEKYKDMETISRKLDEAFLGAEIAETAEMASEQRVRFSTVEDYNASFGQMGRDANFAINSRRRSQSARGVNTTNKPPLVVIVARDDSFVNTLGQFVQAKSHEFDELGVYKLIKVTLPNALLEGGLTIVDSPGIGDNPALTQMVIDYTAEAFAFIYVINCQSKGGVQEDRLKMLLHKVNQAKSLNGRPMFSAASAIFVCNKWDTIRKESKERVMKHIMSGLSECWRGVTPDQLVPFCAYEAVECYKEQLLTPEYKNLLEKFEKLIPFGLENKVFHSVSWLEGVLININNVLVCCLGNLESESNSRRKRFERAKGKMDRLEELNDTYFKKLKTLVDSKVKEAVVSMSEFLQSDETMSELCYWKEKDIPATMKNWEYQRRLISRQLEIRVKDMVLRWERKTAFLNSVIEEIRQNVQVWFHDENIYDELGEIRKIVENRPAVDVMGTVMYGFSENDPADLLEDMTNIYHNNRVAILVASPLIPIVVLIAAIPTLLIIGFKSIFSMGKEQMTIPKLEKYKQDPIGTLNTETKLIVIEYCRSKQAKTYVNELLNDAFELVIELKKVIPTQLLQERNIIETIETDHRSGINKRRTYEPFQQACCSFMQYIRFYALMNLSSNDRGVEMIPFSDVSISDRSEIITKGWFSETVELTVTSLQAEKRYLRKYLPTLTVTDIAAYLAEEKLWRTHQCRQLPRLLAVSVHDNGVYHILTDMGQKCLRDHLNTEIVQCPLDTTSKKGSMKLLDRITRLGAFVTPVLEGLKYLHCKRLVCGDLSLDTVAISTTGTVTLTNATVPKKLHFTIMNILQDYDFIISGRKCRYLPKEILKEGLEGPSSLMGESIVQKTESHQLGIYNSASDVYSLGLLLWELLTGDVAFEAEIENFAISSITEFYEKIISKDCRPTVPDLDACEHPIVHWFHTIEKCWSGKVEGRPDVHSIQKRLYWEIADEFPNLVQDHFHE